MLTQTAVEVGDSAVQPRNDHVQHIGVELHRVPEPTAAASGLNEHRSTLLQHGTQ